MSRKREKEKILRERDGIDGDSEWGDYEREAREIENGNSEEMEF